MEHDVKIEGARDNQPISKTNEIQRVREAEGPKKTADAVPLSSSSPDSVEVSDLTSKTLSSVNASDERIAALRQQHLEGTYDVDSRKIGGKIVDSSLEE
jgi:anti-sigma28 factor (negative regulator of flagellin synthesis)